jgi:hypothetical protein
MMDSVAMIKTGSGIRKLKGRDTQAYRQHGDVISLFLKKESR